LSKKIAYGFKLKRHLHLAPVQKMPDPNGCLRSWHKEGWKMIHLVRRNILRMHLSAILAKSRNVYLLYKGQPALPLNKLNLDCAQLLEQLRAKENQAREDELVLKGLFPLRLTYEDDLLNESSHQKTANKVFAFLGLDSVPVKTEYLRTTPSALSEFIENHEEVYHALATSEFAHYLDG
jgi:hypothetical protein